MQILLVENHPDTLAYIGRYLRICGHGVGSARTIAEAQNKLLAQRYDLLLSDLGLPDGDGWSLLEKLGSSRPRFAIAMSGKNSPTDRARSLEAGYQEHLVKPFAPEDLDRALAGCSYVQLRASAEEEKNQQHRDRNSQDPKQDPTDFPGD
jgi:two-component system CheB/CheR fusion protein